MGREGIRQWRSQHPDEPMDLKGANLNGRDLRGAELLGADFTKATLQGADLGAAGARGALFDEAMARQACFERADLSWASLVAADFAAANVDGLAATGPPPCDTAGQDRPSISARPASSTPAGSDAESPSPADRHHRRPNAPANGSPPRREALRRGSQSIGLGDRYSSWL